MTWGRLREIGPGALIAAAFIGPGTVTICTIAGANYGYTLLWAMVLSIVATIVLQEMAARLGIISGSDLSSVIRKEIKTPVSRVLALGLILVAIVIGNAAYEAGNISGGVLGLDTIVNASPVQLGGLTVNYLSLLIGAIAFALLYIGRYKVIERGLVVMVVLMSISFLTTAIMTSPDLGAIFLGMVRPQMPNQSLLVVVGLIGTTVVPYNLFLHTSLVQEKWNNPSHLKVARVDTVVSIVLGGVVSLAIIICAAAVGNGEIQNVAGLATSLAPLYGHFAMYVLAMGLFAAGITSAITAPFAAAFVVCGCLNLKVDLKSTHFRAVWMSILFLGIIFSSLNIQPLKIILFAQIANGMLLPIIAGFLLWVTSKGSVLGKYKNNRLQKILGLLVFVITVVLGAKSIWKVVEGFQ